MIRMIITLSMLILFAIVPATMVSAQNSAAVSAAELYNTAGELYQNGRFDEALAMYEELIGEGIEHPDLYYNASNAAYRSGNLGLAMLYIERSLRLDPSDRDALTNRMFLNSVKQDQEPRTTNLIISILEETYDRVNIHFAAWFSALLFAVTMGFASAWLFADGKLRLTLLVGTCLGVFAWFFATGMFLHKVHQRTSLHEAIVMEEEVRAYSGPGTENTHIFTIHEGTKVVIEREQNDWRLIRLKSGAGGWLAADVLESVIPLE